MEKMDIQDFSNYLNNQSEKIWQNEKMSLDAKMICMWLYFICKVILSTRGIA